jgi:DNA-binding transcriptional LysR family regulator
LFDRSVQGVSLTPQAELVASYARRLLSINDQIVHIRDAGPRPELVIRVGTPNEYITSLLPGVFAEFRERRRDVRFVVRNDTYDPLVRQLRSGDIDIMLGLSMMPPHDARHSRAEEVVWVRGSSLRIDPDRPVPLVCYSEHCAYHRVAVQVLQSAGLNWEDVLTSPGVSSLTLAVKAGLGVMAVTRRRAERFGLTVWEDAPLPKLPDLYSGIYVRESGARAVYEELADAIAAVLYASSQRRGDTQGRQRGLTSLIGPESRGAALSAVCARAGG